MTRTPRHQLRGRVRRWRRRHPDAPLTRTSRVAHAASTGARDESGAVLILALVFLVTVSLIVGGLTDWVTNDLMNTASFNATQSLNTSATSAVTLGVQNIRYPHSSTPGRRHPTDLTLNASPPSYCWGSGPSQFTDPSWPTVHQTFNMNVYCSTVWNPQSAATRRVTVSACRIPPTLQPGTAAYTTSWTTMQSSCAAQPLLQAIVTFDDYPPRASADPARRSASPFAAAP